MTQDHATLRGFGGRKPTGNAQTVAGRERDILPFRIVVPVYLDDGNARRVRGDPGIRHRSGEVARSRQQQARADKNRGGNATPRLLVLRGKRRRRLTFRGVLFILGCKGVKAKNDIGLRFISECFQNDFCTS